MATSARVRTLRRRIDSAGPADRGDIVLGWLTRVIVLVALLGLLVFEGISLVSSRISGTDMANQVALAASEAYLPDHSTKAAKMAAETEAARHRAEVVKNSLKISKDGTVTVEVRHTATTLLLYRTKRTAEWTVVVSTGKARSIGQ
jgi:Tfp pilus assembly protein PilX